MVWDGGSHEARVKAQPRLSQLSLLPQEVRQVVHADQRVRMIRTEGALRSLQELGGAGPPPGISEMPEMSYFHSACAYIYYRPHLHSFAGIHPKDLTVLPYLHFANYNYEMWMEVPTMYYAQESNPTNIGKLTRKN